MATTFKNFLNNDIASTRTLLHEAIPITGSIVSGTYLENGDNETNIKNYSHGMFQSVYDYPHLSSSANHIFDIAVGYSNSSPLSASTNVQNTEKINIYSQMAQMLVGHDTNGNVLMFDRNGEPNAITAATGDNSGNKMDSLFFLNFARLLTKDEIKKGSISLGIITGSTTVDTRNRNLTKNGAGNGSILTLQDHNATTAYKGNSPSGEYGLLYSASADAGTSDKALGIVYYQAGIAAVTSSIFRDNSLINLPFSNSSVMNAANIQAIASLANPGNLIKTGFGQFGMVPNSSLENVTGSVEACLVSGSISASCGGLRNAIQNIQFNNTTELNSTIYFCRAGHNEFNYSSNPSYIDSASKIRVKSTSLDNPSSYITSIGLYSADNELLAVAKLSEPIKKTPENELTFRVRLDF